MRVTFFCLSLALALAATPQAFALGHVAPNKIEAGTTECVDENSNSFRCARGIERKVAAGLSNTFHRSGDTLRIQIEKETVALIDSSTDSGDSFAAYSYLRFDRRLNSHILFVQYYEGGTYMIIHHQSGQRAFPSGFPLPSPDGKHFLSLSEDMFAGYSSNNVEIWKVSSGAFHRLANYEPEWGPFSGVWTGPRRALVKKRCYAPTERDPAGLKPCGLAKVEQFGSAWKLTE